MKSILPETLFRYPKSPFSIKHLIKSVPNNKEALILDFFAGSATTGQAILELNEDDGGDRRFILCTNNQNFIAENVAYERLHRIITGKTFNNMVLEFEWIKKNKPFQNAKLRVINIDDNIKISLDENVSEKIYNDAKKRITTFRWNI